MNASRAREPLGSALDRHADAFVERFGKSGGAPRVFFAPGRVNLMGAHLDYNGGPVMPSAIDRGTFVAVRARTDDRVRLGSSLDSLLAEVELAALPPSRTGCWADYPLGVVRELVASAGRQPLHGVDVLFGGNLPIGAGLSSSASICVGSALALQTIWELQLDRMEVVHVALRAERNFVGVQCGIMDPYAVGLARTGTLLWIDCKDRSKEWIPLEHEELVIGVADTLVRRELAAGAFNERVAQCARAFARLRAHQPDATCLRDVRAETLDLHGDALDATDARRARHVIDEVARTFNARESLLRGDAATFGAEMTRAHASLREHFEVSVDELDVLVDAAVACEGVLGARLTGAGFGGCVVMLLRRGAEERLRADVTQAYAKRFGRAPTIEFFAGSDGAREFTS